MSSYTTMITKDCPVCSQGGSLHVWQPDYERYINGAPIEEAFADIVAPMREQIISGTHPQCWIKVLEGNSGK